MKLKVVAFEVTPICLIVDDEGVALNEMTTQPFKFYPGTPFDIKKTIERIETIDINNYGSEVPGNEPSIKRS